MLMIKKLNDQFNKICLMLPDSFLLLVSRIAIASVFWRSVQTKITGWEVFGQSLQFFNLSSGTFLLFQYEYNLPVLPYRFAAYAGTFAEFLFPILIIIGLGTRFAALGLLGVTAVIQFLVFPEAWPTHILWFGLLIYLLKQGGGVVSLDYLIRKKFT